MSSSAVRTSAPRWRGHLSLARISNSPTVLTNVLAGAALVGGGGLRMGLVAVAMVLFYTAGMYLNDLLDLNLDRRERPERPLPSGLIPVNEAWVVTAALFGVGGVLLALAGGGAFISGLVLAALIVLYDAWHKTNPLSPVIMAATRALVYVTAALTFTSAPGSALTVWAGLLAAYIIGLTYLAKTENRPGMARYWPVALMAAPVVYALVGAFSWPVGLIALGLAAWIARCLSFVYGKQRNVGAAIGRLIAGVCLLDAVVLASVGAWAWLPVALAAFLLTLWWQRHIKGT
ncbi:UbiA family prenyltransferase [Deinococcus koreensis]|uniref:Prenyltransferase n=1 Tax=Deinococcus koreensis TaxID=2054903 RepID=A0A2K3UWG1_9DEIO|nr:UbiA family prenyltransferase [Deinococcus koreensis]PNY80868.1 prenyltransferase [Deinococcus koreensis]